MYMADKLYRNCIELQKIYDPSCPNTKCGYNQGSGICNYRKQVESGILVKVELSNVIEKLMDGEEIGLMLKGPKIIVVSHENSESIN